MKRLEPFSAHDDLCCGFFDHVPRTKTCKMPLLYITHAVITDIILTAFFATEEELFNDNGYQFLSM